MLQWTFILGAPTSHLSSSIVGIWFSFRVHPSLTVTVLFHRRTTSVFTIMQWMFGRWGPNQKKVHETQFWSLIFKLWWNTNFSLLFLCLKFSECGKLGCKEKTLSSQREKMGQRRGHCCRAKMSSLWPLFSSSIHYAWCWHTVLSYGNQ